jgi:hypothetical protein
MHRLTVDHSEQHASLLGLLHDSGLFSIEMDRLPESSLRTFASGALPDAAGLARIRSSRRECREKGTAGTVLSWIRQQDAKVPNSVPQRTGGWISWRRATNDQTVRLA